MIDRWRERRDRVHGMVTKEFHQIRRDPRLWRIIFIAPLIQLVIFGYAVSTDLTATPIYLVDRDASRSSRALVDALTASGYFRVTGRSRSPGDLVRALDRGDAVLGVEVPPDFSEELGRGSGARIQVLLDGTNSNTATVSMSYVQRIVAGFAADHAVPVITTSAGGEAASIRIPPGAVDLRERAWFNPDLDSQNYNVPAVVGALIMLVCLLLTALAVVREREIGTLDQLEVSPLTPSELILGKTIPFGIIGLVDLAIVTTAAILWFGVPFRGNFAVLLGASVLYLLPSLGMGLLISTVSRTQQQAFMGTFLVFMPTILLSGFMFPISSMPVSFQWATLANPFRHYIEIVRAVFLKGVGLETLWPQFAALLLLGVGLLSAATVRFRHATGGD